MTAPMLRILSHEDLEKIHQAALRILDEIGMEIAHPRAHDLLEGAGARVDRASNRVKLPPELVERSRLQIPKQYTYHGRTPEFDWTASVDGGIGARNTGGCSYWTDPETGEHRPARIADWRAFCTLTDALPNIRALANMICSDVPPRTNDVHSMRTQLEANRKCSVHGAATAASWRYQIEMLLAVRGSREALAERSPVHHMVPPINPLYLGYDYTEQILTACDWSIPIDIPVMSIAGMTSPVTLAGTVAQNLAEELGTATLIQTAHPGHPMAFFLDPVVANMRSGQALTACPESGLLLAAICQLGTELFGLPTEAVGLYSDGYSAAQTMGHKYQSVIFQALSGGKMFVGAGCTESITTLSASQIVIDDELMAIATRWLRGITVDDDTLAVDVLAEVGPRGNFLSEEHTVRHMRAGELLDIPLAERDGRRDLWELSGRQTLESRALDRARSILATHEVPPLPDEVLRELARITEAADRELSGAGKPGESLVAGVH
jgi:trimethylamine---corrinoid protein Co-methyltransferase